MIEVIVSDKALREAAQSGMDEFVTVFINAINAAIDGQLTADTMANLNADQVTLLAYGIMRDEVMDGGFVQLIHNGYGPFFFHNPFARAVRLWGLQSLAVIVNKGHKLYAAYGKEIERECTDDEFMALFERFPQFDDLDDCFVENEEEWTSTVAAYIDNHIERFARITE